MLAVGGVAVAANWQYATPGSDAADSYTQVTTWNQYPECVVGREQSPINIVSNAAAVAPRTLDDSIELFLPPREVTPRSNAHAFELHEMSPVHYTMPTKGVPSKSQTPTGLSKGYTVLRNEKYNFYQVQWHTPSENTIDGKSFAMEAQFIHQLADEEFMAKAAKKRSGYSNYLGGTSWPNTNDEGVGTLVGTLEHLAVLGVLYELSTECNAFLDQFWDLFPPDGEGLASSEVTLDLEAMLEPLLEGGYYHWDGSTTSPPCAEGVDWNLFKTTVPVCQRQVDRLRAALGKTQDGVTVNNRVVQPINDRVVLQTSSGTIWKPLAALSFALSSIVVIMAFALVIMCRKVHKIQKKGVASPIVTRRAVKLEEDIETPKKTSTQELELVGSADVAKIVSKYAEPSAMDTEKNPAAVAAEAATKAPAAA